MRPQWTDKITEGLEQTRRRTRVLVEPLSDTVLRRQVKDYLSPLAWDLAHIANFEEVWLLEALAGSGDDLAALDADLDALETPRAARADLDLPGGDEALQRLGEVRGRVLGALARNESAADRPLLRDGYVFRMVMQHEGQHQETMLQALDLPDSWNSAGDHPGKLVGPALRDGAAATSAIVVDELARTGIPAGLARIGTADRSRAYDNERPAHTVHVDAFEIERYPVTNGRWRAFIDDGGYRRAELWSPPGRAWLTRTGCRAPQGWVQDRDWSVRRLGRRIPLAPFEPVQHVSFWEAEAFATWCGGRLPTEHEWEKAVCTAGRRSAGRYPWGDADPAVVGLIPNTSGTAAFVGDGPPPIGLNPQLGSEYGVEDALGSVYEWTSSPFAAYPGFEPFPYPEYSTPFFGGPYRVLRGASWAALPMLWRSSYRNWDFPQRRQIFAGLRVAYDVA